MDGDRVSVRVSAEPIDPNDALRAVADPACGASCLFVGTVRDHSDRGAVTGMHYEAWVELAVLRLEEVAAEILASGDIRRVALIHRYGDLTIGEVSVAIACSSPHRGDAFVACQLGIERLKEEAPIWKRESLTTGESEWVMGS